LSDDLDPDELIAQSGDFIGHALPHGSPTATELSREPDWLALADQIGDERAKILNDGADPTDQEQSLMLRYQVEQALESPNDDVTPGIWFCLVPKGELAVVLCWDGGWDCSRELFGVYQNREDAVAALRKKFIFSVEEL
jgi:hypothetical protein